MAIVRRRVRHFIRRLVGSPKCLVNTLLSLVSLRLRLLRAIGEPVVLDIEPTNACNFRCPHCQVTHAGWARRSLDAALFSGILDRFPNALRVKLQGMGEPFLHKALIDLVDTTCRRGYWCEVVSNGSLWHSWQMERLGRHDNFQLVVSIDAATPEKFHSVRPGSDFARIISNVGHVCDKTAVNLAAWMVVSRDTQGEAEGVVRLLASLGVKQLGLQMVVVDYGKPEMDERTVARRVPAADRPLLYDRLRSAAREVGMQLDIADRVYDHEHPCPWPWLGVYVDLSGNVLPCCRLGDARVVSMGNLHEQDFGVIWNSDLYRVFRRAHRDGRIPKICAACYESDNASPPA